MIKIKYKSMQFGQMNLADLSAIIRVLLLKIHVITGWIVPDGEFLIALLDQFEKKIRESYLELNPDEIEFAFRSKGTLVEDWGKSMNLNLMDKVLLPYLDERYRVSETERQINYYKRRPEFNAEKDCNWRGMIEEDYQFFISGKSITFFPQHYYAVLVDDGFLAPELYKDFLQLSSGNEDAAKDKCIQLLFQTAAKNKFPHLYTK